MGPGADEHGDARSDIGWDRHSGPPFIGVAAALQALCDETGMSPKYLLAYQTVWFVESRRGEGACTEPPANKLTEKIVVDPTASLLSYQLHPENLIGKALFAHQCRMRSRRMEPPKSVYNWGLDWLDVEVRQEQYTIFFNIIVVIASLVFSTML